MEESLIDQMRLLSMANGQLYPLQIHNLKCIPLVIFGEKLSNEFQIDFDKRTISFTLKGESNFPQAETKVRLEHLIKYVQRLIGNFEVSILLNEKKLNGRTSKDTGKRKSKRDRKKRLRKVSKRK